MERHETNAPQTTFVNVMEALVAEEVSRQLKTLPERMLKYIKRAEIEAFALNRLPALYASSQAGLQHQETRAAEFEPQITRAVRQALMAVQADPLRASQPIARSQTNPEAEAVLQGLRNVLKTPNLNWQNALKEIQTLEKLLGRPRNEHDGGGHSCPEGTRAIPRDNHSASPTQPSQQQSRRPGLYGGYRSYQQRAMQG